MAKSKSTAPAGAPSHVHPNDRTDARIQDDASEVPAVIAGSVNLMAFSGALAQVGIIGRFDRDRGVLVIEPAQERRQDDADVRVGIAWYNGLTPTERRQWHEVAGSAVPADCWRAFQSGMSLS